MENSLKVYLDKLLPTHEYDPNNTRTRKVLAYIFIPILQSECDGFVRLWNSHRVRPQCGLQLPTGLNIKA